MWPQILKMAGWLGWAFGLYWVYVLGWTILLGRRPDHAKYWMKFISHLKIFKEKSDGLIPVGSAVFAAFILAGMFLGASRIRYNVVTEHNVLVLARLDNGDFLYKSDEKPDGDTYRPCAIDKQNGIDVDGMLKQAADGKYIALRATWEEQGICRSILKPEWQFWFRDAEHTDYRKAEDAK